MDVVKWQYLQIIVVESCFNVSSFFYCLFFLLGFYLISQLVLPFSTIRCIFFRCLLYQFQTYLYPGLPLIRHLQQYFVFLVRTPMLCCTPVKPESTESVFHGLICNSVRMISTCGLISLLMGSLICTSGTRCRRTPHLIILDVYKRQLLVQAGNNTR